MKFYERFACPVSDEVTEPEEGKQVMSETAWLKARQYDFSEITLTKEMEQFLDHLAPYSICASEAGAVLGVNPWESTLELFHEKKGIHTDKDMNTDALHTGHVFEDPIRRLVTEDVEKELPSYLSILSGYPANLFSDCRIKVWEDKRMFVNYSDPFMLADPDGFCEISGMIEGHRLSFNGYVEIKTVSGRYFEAQKAWKEGIVPPSYEAQCMHCMHVFGADFAIISAAWGLQSDFRAHKLLTRDMTIPVPCKRTDKGAKAEPDENGIIHYFREVGEEDLVQAEEAFSLHLSLDIAPENDIQPLLQNKYYARLYGATDHKSVELKEDDQKVVEQIASIDEEIRQQEAVLKQLNVRREEMISKLYPVFESHDKASFTDDGKEYTLTCKAGLTRASFDFDALKEENPAVFAEVVDQTTNYKLNSKAKTKKYKSTCDEYRIPGKPNGERKWKLAVKDLQA